jgi:hypothetical protein
VTSVGILPKLLSEEILFLNNFLASEVRKEFIIYPLQEEPKMATLRRMY